MLFLILNYMNMNFLKQDLFERIYISIETFLIIKQVELVEKKKFSILALRSKKNLFNTYSQFFQLRLTRSSFSVSFNKTLYL